MKKSYIIFFTLPFFLTHLSFGQNVFLKKGRVDFHAGFGVVPSFFADRAKTIAHPVQLGVSVMVSKRFSLGVEAGRSISAANRTYLQYHIRYDNHLYYGGLRGLIHFAPTQKSSYYGGFIIGYHRSVIHIDDPEMADVATLVGIGKHKGRLVYSGIVGGQYAFGKRWRAYGELGYQTSIATLGLIYTIK